MPRRWNLLDVGWVEHGRMSTLVAPYESTFGPRILFAPDTLEDLRELEQFLRRMAQESEKERSLADEINCRTKGIRSLIARHTEVSPPMRLVQVGNTPGALEFVWSCSAQDWVECAEMVGAMGKEPGFQLLSGDAEGEVVIEVSFLEPGFARKVEEAQ